MKSYELSLHEDKAILDWFTDTWPISVIETMSIDQYTGVNDQFTFTQFVENRTRVLGGIQGMSSLKFGVYKRKKPHEKPKNKVYSSETHSWLKSYGECELDESIVFEKVRERLLRIIRFAQILDFESIEKVDGLYNLFKWKIAFLYSKQSMVPVFNQKVLIRFTTELGLEYTSKANYAKRHRYLYNNKPPNVTVFNFMRKLFYEADLFDNKLKKDNSKQKKTKRRRKGVDDLNANDQFRKGSNATIIVQHHKKIQQQLKDYLSYLYPNAEITFEKNFIDLLLVSEKEIHYYEVKTALTSEACIKQGLGQLLSYFFYEEQQSEKDNKLEKKIVIVGMQRPTKYDLNFIDYINQSLNVNFEYLSIEKILIETKT